MITPYGAVPILNNIDKLIFLFLCNIPIISHQNYGLKIWSPALTF